MVGGVRFVTGDPFGEGQARSSRNLASQFALSEEERQSREAQGVDDALRLGMQNIRGRPGPAGQSLSSIGTVTPQGPGAPTRLGPQPAGPRAAAPSSGIEGGGSPGFGSPMLASPPMGGIEGGGSAGFGAPIAAPGTMIDDVRPRSPLSRVQGDLPDAGAPPDTSVGPTAPWPSASVTPPESGQPTRAPQWGEPGYVPTGGGLTSQIGRLLFGAGPEPRRPVQTAAPGADQAWRARSGPGAQPSTVTPPAPWSPFGQPRAPETPASRAGEPVPLGPTQAPFGNPDPNPRTIETVQPVPPTPATQPPFGAPDPYQRQAAPPGRPPVPPTAIPAAPPSQPPLGAPDLYPQQAPVPVATIDTVSPQASSLRAQQAPRGGPPVPMAQAPAPQPRAPAPMPIPTRPVAGVAPQEASPPAFGGGAPRAAAAIAGGGAMQAQPGAATLPANGRPILQNPDGSISTERSITVTDPRLNGGRPTNIPSIWNGQQLDEDGAVQAAIASGQQFQSWNTIDEAVAEAVRRSESLGRPAPTSSIDTIAPTGDRGVMSDASDGMGLGQRAQALPPVEGRAPSNNPMALTTGRRGPGGGLMFRNWDNRPEGIQTAQAQLVRNADRLTAAGQPVTAETITRHPQFGWAAGDPRNVAYPAAIAAATGLPPNAPLNLRDPRVMQQVTQAIIGTERVPGGAAAAPTSTPGAPAATPSSIDTATPRGVDWLSLARAAASVPGGGSTAVRLAQLADTGMHQDVQHRDAIEMQALTAAARGDVAGARYWAQRGGINLPDAVLNDAQMARGLTIAERFYREDHPQALQFAQTYAASGGNLEQAWQAAGPPRSNSGITFRDVRDGADVVNLMINQRGGTRTEIGRGRAPTVISAEGALERANIAADARVQAADIAAQARQIRQTANANPNTLMGRAQMLADERAGGTGLASNEDVVRSYNEIRAAGQSTLNLERFAARFLDPADHLSRQVPQNIRSMRDGPEKSAAVQNWVRTVFLGGGGATPSNPVAAAAASAPRPSQAATTPGRPAAATTRESPAHPTSPEEAQALPSGSWYVRADNGELRQRP